MREVIKAVEEVQAAIDHVPEERRMELALSLTVLSKKLLSSIAGLGDIPEYYRGTISPEITAQLAAAEKRTERATDAFLSAAERIGELANKADKEMQNALQAEVNAIFEAASFQDLVAQHLSEVKLRLQELDTRMEALQAVFDGDGEQVRQSQQKMQAQTKDGLLNGPSTQV